MLRKHQRELGELLDKIIDEYKTTGKLPKKSIFSSIFPGGGKSVLPIIALQKLSEAGIVDKVCWVVPRSSLKIQGAQEFAKGYLKSLFPHNLEIRELERVNDVNPTRGGNGFITTYQALVAARNNNKGRQNNNEYEFDNCKYLLVLDEFHHVSKNAHDEEERGYYEAVKPLYDRAAFVLGMTGTIKRHDEEETAFVEYKENESTGNKAPVLDLEYTYDDALNEKAIIPLYCNKAETLSVKYERNGEKVDKTSIENKTDLSVAIDSEIGKNILKAGITHWMDYKANANPRSKLIIIGHSQKHCKDLATEVFSIKPTGTVLAISDEKNAHENIKTFRTKPGCEILITCQMAYEGLDCKEATHLIILTRIRSIPWLIQALTRIMRYDKDGIEYKKQNAFAFAPDDKEMSNAIKYVGGYDISLPIDQEDELTELLGQLENDEDGGDNNEPTVIENKSSAIRGYQQADAMGNELGSDLMVKVQMFMSKNKIRDVPEIKVYETLRAANALGGLGEFISVEEEVLKQKNSDDIDLTIREKEAILRKKIQRKASLLDRKFYEKDGFWNKKIFNAFRGKNRKDMILDELQKCYRWLLNEAKNEAKQRLSIA